MKTKYNGGEEQQMDSLQRKVKEAEQSMANKDFLEAISHYRLAYQLDTEGVLSPHFYFRYGIACQMTNDPEDAVRIWKIGHEKYPTSRALLASLA